MKRKEEKFSNYSRNIKKIFRELEHDVLIESSLEKKNMITIMELLQTIFRQITKGKIDQIFLPIICEEVLKEENFKKAHSAIFNEVKKLGMMSKYQADYLSLLVLSSAFNEEGHINSLEYAEFSKNFKFEENYILNDNIKWYIALITPATYSFNKSFEKIKKTLYEEIK